MESCSPSEELFTIAFSAIFCTVTTVVYLLIDFDKHEPLFFVFLGISCFILITEYGEKLLCRVFGAPITAKVKKDTDSTVSSIRHAGNFIFALRRKEKWTRFWIVTWAFMSALILSQKMDDAALIYATCMLFSSSPIWKKIMGKSAQEFTAKVSQLFEPPSTESAELADYMPDINEVSQDLSVRIRRNSNDSTATDCDLEISVFGEENLPSLETSAVSVMNESQFIPLSARSYGKSTDDDTSPIPSDVEMVDADDCKEDFVVNSMQSGGIESQAGEYTPSGTLRRSIRIRDKRREN